MNFVIITPQYDSKSNGILLLYQLVPLLENAGATVFLFPYSEKEYLKSSELVGDDIKKKFVLNRKELPADSYCITPEITPIDVLEATQGLRRIWFFLNKPMVINTVALPIKPEDCIVSYSTIVARCYFNLFINQPLQTVLEPINRADKENIILCYIGKGIVEKAIYDQIVIFSRKNKGLKLLPITRALPKHKCDYYKLLKRAKLLICFDPITNVIYESILHGTPVYLPYPKEHFDFTSYNVSYDGVFYEFESLDQWICNGIPHDKAENNLREYHRSIADGGVNKVLEFVKNAKNWFDVVEGKTSDRDSLRYFEDEIAQVRAQLGALGVGANKVSLSDADLHSESVLNAALHLHNENRLRLMHEEYKMLGSICANHLVMSKKHSESFLSRKKRQLLRIWQKHLLGMSDALRYLKSNIPA